MIIVRLQGGLGNQLFQYTAGRALSIHLNTPFKLDNITSKKNNQRTYALSWFNINPQMATKKEIKKIICFPKLYRYKPKLFAKYKPSIYVEPHFHFSNNFFNLKNPVYLDGYWQSEKYFSLYETIVREDLTIQKKYIEHLNVKINEMKNCNSVAIHIRRGDYTNSKILYYHGLLQPSYYTKAIDYIANQTQSIKLYFFSDDINWVKENIQISHPHEFVTSYTKSAIEDFYLMSQCKHNITANSSFSWWAAWLNPNPSKIVIAPKKWFNKSPHNTTDLIPNEWIKL
jgi:hypothetical protein